MVIFLFVTLLEQCCLSEFARLALLSVMAYPCNTDQTYNRTLSGLYIPRQNGSLSYTNGYKPNLYKMKLLNPNDIAF